MTTVATVGTLPADLLSAELSAQPVTVAFLRELARVRDIPLSVPLAFNALAYAYDLQAGQYDPALLSAARLPAVAADTTIDALPVGALAQLATGGAPQPFEVIFRHGEHTALHGDGSSPAWLSGAPAGVTTAPGTAGDGQAVPTGEVVLTERLIIDATALGAGAPERLRRLTGRAITAEGHLVVQAAYLDAEQADLDDTRLYASYLLSRRPEDLRRCLAVLGPIDTPDALASTLHATFDVLAALLDAAGLLRWHDKYVHPDTYARWEQGDEHVRTVEPSDANRFCMTAARMCLPRTQRGVTWPGKPAYLAIGPTLRVSVTDPDAADLPAAGLRGPQYATALTCAQLYLAQTLTERHDGIVEVSGAEVHVRLDDAWQGGGIWRAHVLERNELVDPVDLPLALGWLTTLQPDVPVHPTWHTPAPAGHETTRTTPAPPPAAPDPEPAENTADPEPTVEPTSEPDPEPPADSTPQDQPEPEPEPEDDGTGAVDRWVDDTTLGWRFVLGPRHAGRGTLPLTPKVAAAMRTALARGTGLHLDLSHPGTDLPPERRRQRVVFDGRTLTGLHWPDSLFLGIRLTASWSTDGYQVALSTTALDEPVDVDGIPLDYEFNPEVVLRYLLAVDLDADADVLAPASLRALVRKQGRLAGPGSAALFVPLRELLAAAREHAGAAGSPLPTTEQLCQALEVATAASTGAVRLCWGVLLTRDDGDGRWLAPRWPCPCDPDWHREPSDAALSAGDPAIVLSLHPAAADRPSRRPDASSGLPGTTEEFLRRGHLRRLPRGQSPRQRELAVAYARTMGWDPRTLDPRTTFVSESYVRH